MQRTIPSKESRRWKGPYLGSYYGDLWKTFNIDLDKKEGLVSLSQRMQRIEDTSEFTGIDNPMYAFIRTDADCTDRYWALSYNDGLLKTDSASPENQSAPQNDWDTDALSNSPPDPLDFTIHGNDSRNDSGRNKLFVTRDTGDIAVLNDTGNNAWTASWWVTKQGQAALNRFVPFHPIEYFPLTKITIVGDGNLVHTISRPTDTQNDTISYARLILPKNLVNRHIFPTRNRAWMLCYDKYGGGGVIEWDGFSQTYNNFHNTNGAPILGVNYSESPIVLNSRGFILEYNGNGFVPMVRNGQTIAIPMAEERGNSLMNITSADSSINWSAAPRGMVVGEDNLIYFNLIRPQGGIFTIPSSERYSAGVWCLNPVTGRLYNKFSIGVFGDSTDYGHQDQASAGGIYWVPGAITGRNLLVGGNISISSSGSFVSENGIWLLEAPGSTTINRGYFITQYIPADMVDEFWDTVWVKFKKFINSGAKIIVKARGSRGLIRNSTQAPFYISCTWTSTTTFTVTLNSADEALAVGDEIEVLAGANAGYLAHITVISGAHGALQTMTIDDAVKTASNELSVVTFDRWKKCKVIDTTTKYEDMANIGIDSSFVQFKIELRGAEKDMEVSMLLINSKDSNKKK